MSTLNYQNLFEGLATLSTPDGKPPKTRMDNPEQTRDIISRAINYDMTTRDWKRSRLAGLVNGNPPYSQAALVDAGRGDECNVNWRIAKYFLEMARGMVYDVFSEATTYATVSSNPELPNSSEASNIITEGFDKLQRSDVEFDFTNQQSQGQMVMYGTGPQIFDDCYDWRTISIESKSLFVPEMARSNVNRWEWAAVIQEYTPDRLYARIMNPELARSTGWNVPATRRSIMNAHPLTRTGAMYQNWSWHQDVLKNGSFFYADQSKMVRVASFYFREFPEDGEDEGRITECMVDLDSQSSTSTDGRVEYLYMKERAYGNWQEKIHPMFWNHDINGYYHSVSGLGLEMFSALEYENRLLCRLADDAFAPKLFFKPTTASERERMSIAQIGRYAVLPAALEMVQQHVQPFLQDGIAMHREVQGLVSSNLSQFRSSALTKQQGNPVTARQIDYEASEQAKMGKTQLSRIYEQYDWLYAEKFRRAVLCPASARGGKQAREFVKWCEKRGVSEKMLKEVESVKATRVVGQGSSFMRQQALEFLLGLLSMLPETGRENLIKQVIASRAGQSKVKEFWPDPQTDTSMLAQQSDAMLQVAAMKEGVPPVSVPTQNPMIYAATFLQAADSAAQSIQQGGDPHAASAFLDLAIPATAGHLQRMSGDKTREQALRQMEDKLKELNSFNDEVKTQLSEQAQQQAAAQQQMAAVQNGTDPETQIGMAKVQAKHSVDMAKLQANMQLKATKQQADQAFAARRLGVESALKDATVANVIRLDQAKTVHKLAMDKATTAADIQMARAKAAATPKPASNGKD